MLLSFYKYFFIPLFFFVPVWSICITCIQKHALAKEASRSRTTRSGHAPSDMHVGTEPEFFVSTEIRYLAVHILFFLTFIQLIHRLEVRHINFINLTVLK